MRIARVFTRKTSMTPVDEDVYFGVPPALLDIKYDEVHISCTFSLDRDVNTLASCWGEFGTVRIGGPAFGDPGGEFTPGLYLKKGVTITSRGCPRNCPWCYVPGREGKIRELEIHAGNNIQDNNLLACSKEHIKKVFAMLRTQKAIDFGGGLDCRLLKDWHIEELRSLKIHQIWLAYDNKRYLPAVKRAAEKLTKYFKRDKLRCYCLIGYGDEKITTAAARLKTAWELGFLPFAMRYDGRHYYTKDWSDLTRNWCRQAITRGIMKAGTEQLANQTPLFGSQVVSAEGGGGGLYEACGGEDNA